MSARPGHGRRRQRGVTLMELLTVVAVIGILAAIAFPSYRAYIQRTQRTDATSALLRVASAQEKFYLANNTYADSDGMADAPPDGLGIPSTDLNLYDLSIESDDLALGYTVVAVPTEGGAQADDEDCARFTLDQSQRRTAETAGGDANTEACWR